MFSLTSCSSDDDASSDSSDGITGTYYLYDFHEEFYAVDEGGSTLVMGSEGTDYNDAAFTYSETGTLNGSGSFSYVINTYLGGVIVASEDATWDLDNGGFPEAYDYDEEAGTFTFGPGVNDFLYAEFSDNQLTLTYEDEQLDEDGEGSHYIQTWVMAK